MPYPEYRSWELFYLVEPFGFENDEYHTAAILAMLYNVNRGKGKAKNVRDFMRDMPKAVLKEFENKPESMSKEELVKQIKKDFGIK